MVSIEYVNQQLDIIGYRRHFWVNPEINELANILMPSEEIVECVSGNYEGGGAFLVVTNERLLLIDKKVLQFLTIEDMRFDKINQIDYSYRLIAAYLNVNSGLKNLKFSSLNKVRLRKLVNYIQVFITESKKNETIQIDQQSKHLEGINHRLSTYLKAQDQTLNELSSQLRSNQNTNEQINEPETYSHQSNQQLIDMAKREIVHAKNFIHSKSSVILDKEKRIRASYFIGKIIFADQSRI